MTRDILKQRPALFLGSRLKRLAEQMQSDVAQVAVAAGISIQPGQYSLLATLDAFGPQTITDLTQAMELSQPAVTRMAAKLAENGLVTIDRLHKDQRHKTVTLTRAGMVELSRSKQHVWPRVEAAVNDLLCGLSGSLLEQIDTIERRLASVPLNKRAQVIAEEKLTILEFTDELAPAFRSINSQWIESMYSLEQTDRDVLDHPRERIIDTGGHILLVEADGLGVVGACALQKTGERQYELTKMGVLESARGRKVGEFLLKAVISRARQLKAKRLYLLTNKKSAAAIHLYEKLGFVHDDDIMREFGSRYARCDVAMLHRSRS
jgi:N-acetylglutamate synthase-like GNAT family acetyltransferase/DNA-binding MarR family transcriptional regulator